MNQALHFRLLGGFSVFVNQTLIPDEAWRSKRTRSLVKLLALAPAHRLHRDQILDTLWPDSDFSAASNNLHQTLYNTRKIFDKAGAVSLLLEDGFLSLGDGICVDVDVFETAADQALKQQEPAQFQSALALYTGDLLPEDLYEDWAVSRRESLRLLRLKRAGQAADLESEAGRRFYIKPRRHWPPQPSPAAAAAGQC